MIPDWMPKEAWEAYISMRKGMGKKFVATEYAQKLLIKKLDAWRNEGQNIEEIINQSIERSWTGLFAIKQEGAKKDTAWWSTDELALKKGREMSMEPRVGESMYDFKGRIRTVIEHGGIEARAQSRTYQHDLLANVPEATDRSVAKQSLQEALRISRIRH